MDGTISVNEKSGNYLIDWNGPNIPSNGKPLIPIPSVLNNNILQSATDDNPFDAVERQITLVNDDPFGVFASDEKKIQNDKILDFDDSEMRKELLRHVSTNEFHSKMKDECVDKKLINVSPKQNFSVKDNDAPLNIQSIDSLSSKINDRNVDNCGTVVANSVNEDYLIQLSEDEIIKYVKNRVDRCVQNTLNKLETDKPLELAHNALVEKLKSSSVSPCVLENLKYRSRLSNIIDSDPSTSIASTLPSLSNNERQVNSSVCHFDIQSSILDTLDVHDISNNKYRLLLNSMNDKFEAGLVKRSASFDDAPKRKAEFTSSATKTDGVWNNNDFGCDLSDENISSITPCLQNLDITFDDNDNDEFIGEDSSSSVNTVDIKRCLADNGKPSSRPAFVKGLNENMYLNLRKDVQTKPTTTRQNGPMRAILPLLNMVKVGNGAKKTYNSKLTETPKAKNIKPVAASTPSSASVTPTSTVSNFRSINRKSLPHERSLLEKHINLRSSSLSRVRVPSPDSTSGKSVMNKTSSPVVRPRNQQQTVGKFVSRVSVSSTTNFISQSTKLPLNSISSNTRSRTSIAPSINSKAMIKPAVINKSWKGKENILPRK